MRERSACTRDRPLPRRTRAHPLALSPLRYLPFFSVWRGFDRDLLEAQVSAVLNQQRHERCPSGLMTGAESLAGITMEVLVERHVVMPVRVMLEEFVLTEHGAAPAVVAHEETREPGGQFVGHLRKCQEASRSGRTLHGERIAVVAGGRGECLDQEKVHRHPDRTSPVGVASE